ncbi:MAG: hypothetical protein GX096_07640 [Clostridiales bacterium]|nr:hypothetical protein [Clostridiales bacterium]
MKTMYGNSGMTYGKARIRRTGQRNRWRIRLSVWLYMQKGLPIQRAM